MVIGLDVHKRSVYATVMESIAAGLNNWSAIKAYVTTKTGYISSTILNNHIKLRP